LTAGIKIGLAGQFDDIGTEIQARLARTGQHRLPVGRRSIAHDDRDRLLRLRPGGRPKNETGSKTCGDHNPLHDHFLPFEAPRDFRIVRRRRI
jgi:hypothetical protein